MNFLFVGLGGATGAMLRYAVGLIPYKGNFPIITLIINIIGAFAIGFIAGVASESKLSRNMVLFLKTGLCGGFTTFSAFSLEAYNLFSNGNYFLAAAYAVLSTVICIVGVWLGAMLASAVVKA